MYVCISFKLNYIYLSIYKPSFSEVYRYIYKINKEPKKNKNSISAFVLVSCPK